MQKNDICKQVIRSIRNYLHDPDCLSPHRKEKCFVRNRSLSMLQVIQFLFYSSKASMCQNLASIIFDLPEINFPDVSKQAISKARQGIKPSLILRYSNPLIYIRILSLFSTEVIILKLCFAIAWNTDTSVLCG